AHRGGRSPQAAGPRANRRAGTDGAGADCDSDGDPQRRRASQTVARHGGKANGARRVLPRRRVAEPQREERDMAVAVVMDFEGAMADSRRADGLAPQAVRTSGAPSVMTIVCSSWAESAPSAVHTVQPSPPWRTAP